MSEILVPSSPELLAQKVEELLTWKEEAIVKLASQARSQCWVPLAAW